MRNTFLGSGEGWLVMWGNDSARIVAWFGNLPGVLPQATRIGRYAAGHLYDRVGEGWLVKWGSVWRESLRNAGTSLGLHPRLHASAALRPDIYTIALVRVGG